MSHKGQVAELEFERRLLALSPRVFCLRSRSKDLPDCQGAEGLQHALGISSPLVGTLRGSQSAFSSAMNQMNRVTWRGGGRQPPMAGGGWGTWQDLSKMKGEGR